MTARPSGIRRRARELALQLLFQDDVIPTATERVAARPLDASPDTPEPVRAFANRLVEGVRDHREEADALIRKYAQHWTLERMAPVDRNVLRLAVFELLHIEDIPVRVTLDEAIEIAKRYGDMGSSAFVNGILDQVVHHEALPAGKFEKALAHKTEPAETDPHD